MKKKKGTKDLLIERLLPSVDKITSATENTVKATINFLKKETPEVTKEIIRWGVIDTLTWFILGLILTVISYFKFDLEKLFAVETWYQEIIPAITLIVGVLIVITSTEWIKPMITPRLYLLEWLNKKIKR